MHPGVAQVKIGHDEDFLFGEKESPASIRDYSRGDGKGRRRHPCHASVPRLALRRKREVFSTAPQSLWGERRTPIRRDVPIRQLVPIWKSALRCSPCWMAAARSSTTTDDKDAPASREDPPPGVLL